MSANWNCVARDRPHGSHHLAGPGGAKPGAECPGLPSADQSYCDLRRHQQCSGYTEDEFDPESCMCACHDTTN